MNGYISKSMKDYTLILCRSLNPDKSYMLVYFMETQPLLCYPHKYHSNNDSNGIPVEALQAKC